MRFTTLSDWLDWQETLHPAEIELGLECINEVYQQLAHEKTNHVVITVAGTNGKGSCVAFLEAILTTAGYRVGTYTSPHLVRYNERIRINAQDIDDQSLCEAFERVDQARGDTSITYFEFGTLAALDIFNHANLDIVILETGMGGRLDELTQQLRPTPYPPLPHPRSSLPTSSSTSSAVASSSRTSCGSAGRCRGGRRRSGTSRPRSPGPRPGRASAGR